MNLHPLSDVCEQISFELCFLKLWVGNDVCGRPNAVTIIYYIYTVAAIVIRYKAVFDKLPDVIIPTLR